MILEDLLNQINDTGFTVLDPSKRLFWGNILGAALLLLIIPGADKLGRFKILFSKKRWLHRSSLADMQVVALNTLLRIFLFPASILSSVAVAAAVSLMLTYAFGGKPQLDLPPFLTSAAFTLCLFLADDFARFYLHYLQHRWPYFWVFHQTHHSALVLTPLTLLRTHPFEILTARIRNALTYGIVTGIFFYAIGEKVTAWDILGIEILGLTFNFLGANLRHSEVWIHFGRLEKIFISPAAHQVHHSIDEIHYDKNFGVCLALWDRLFKTHFDPRTVKGPIKFGLLDSPLSDPKQYVHVLYLEPFKDLYGLLKARYSKKV
jgi:sterol desaturase/sphingolipid hydroxylase (fatty acid hydroxylase superfamily)